MVSSNLDVGVPPNQSITWHYIGAEQLQQSRFARSVRSDEGNSRVQVDAEVDILVNPGLKFKNFIFSLLIWLFWNAQIIEKKNQKFR